MPGITTIMITTITTMIMTTTMTTITGIIITIIMARIWTMARVQRVCPSPA